jgi:hypothetical protein
MAKCGEQLTGEELRQKKLLKRIDGIGFLYPPFAQVIADLMLVMRQHQMPFIIYETYRTPERQQKLTSLGLSKIRHPLEDKHVHGLAVDFLIDYRAVRSLKKNKLSKLTESDLDKKSDQYSDDYGAVYNLGVNAIPTPTNAPRTKVQDQVVLDFWNNLGKLIDRQFPDLVWGGKFNMEGEQLIGTDPPHIEYRHAPTLMQQGRALRFLRGRGNPGLEKIRL